MSFLYPNVFFMLLIPLIVLVILILTNKDNMQSYFSKEVLDRLSVGGKTLGKTTRNGLFFFCLVLFIIAMARPVMDKKELDVTQRLIPVVIALDISKSMKAADIFPNRISLAKEKLKSIINLSKNSTIGVVLFAKDSYILSPVTEDLVSLNYIVDNLDTSVDVSNGSNISAVLNATNHMLKDFRIKNLIILSDGGNDDSYSDELEFAKANGISIYSIGLATKKGSPIPEGKGYLTDKQGKIVTVKLNDSIKDLSIKTGGGYIDFTLDNGDVDAIVERINLQSKKEELSSQKMKIYKELFYFPLGLGLFVLLLAFSSVPSFKRKNGTAVLAAVLIFGFANNKAQAFEFEFEKIQKAKEYYENGEFPKASDEYRKVSASAQSLYNLANSLYKQKKYDEAIKTYSKIVTDNKELEYKKLHNLGNSYVNKNELLKAKEFYEKALKIKEDKETRENLELVNKELEKKQKNKDQKENKQDQDKQDSQKEQNKDKQESGNKDSQNKDNKEKKEQDKKESRDQKQESKDQDKEKDSKNKEPKKDDKKNKDENKQQTAASKAMQENKPQPISDMEEKKWMQILEKQKTPIYIRKMDSKEGNNNDEQPW